MQPQNIVLIATLDQVLDVLPNIFVQLLKDRLCLLRSHGVTVNVFDSLRRTPVKRFAYMSEHLTSSVRGRIVCEVLVTGHLYCLGTPLTATMLRPSGTCASNSICKLGKAIPDLSQVYNTCSSVNSRLS